MAHRLTRDEMETIIRWDEAQNSVHICTSSPVTIRKLDRLVELCPEAYKLIKRTDYDKFYETKPRYIRFGRTPTEAQKQARYRFHPELQK